MLLRPGLELEIRLPSVAVETVSSANQCRGADGNDQGNEQCRRGRGEVRLAERMCIARARAVCADYTR